MKMMVIIGEDHVVDDVAKNIEKAHELGPDEFGFYGVEDAWDDLDPMYQMRLVFDAIRALEQVGADEKLTFKIVKKPS